MPFARRLLVAGSVFALVGCEAASPEPDQEPLFTTSVGADGAAIFETEWGDIIAADSGQARMGAMELRAASAAFFTHFGVRPERGCVRAVNAGETVPECPPGLAWETPWMAPDYSSYLAKTETRPAVMHQRLVGFGLEADTPAVRLSHQLMHDERRCREDQSALKMATHLRHELAHKFFVDSVWPNARSTLIYGGDAPDWLDEAAAMTADVPVLRRSREIRFATMIAEGRIIPMAEFLSMEHPSMPEIRRMTTLAVTTQTPQVTISRVDPDDPAQARSLDYYAQSQVLADFLIARSDNRRALRDLSDSLRSGMDFGAWLRSRTGIDAGQQYKGLGDAVIEWASQQGGGARRDDQIACGD